MSDEIHSLAGRNVADVLANGPGLRIGRSIWVCAADEPNGWVLISGLGGMGVGTMWFPTQEHHRTLAGWDDAPRVVTESARDIEVDGVIRSMDRRIIEGDAQAAYRRTAVGILTGDMPADGDA